MSSSTKSRHVIACYLNSQTALQTGGAITNLYQAVKMLAWMAGGNDPEPLESVVLAEGEGDNWKFGHVSFFRFPFDAATPELIREILESECFDLDGRRERFIMVIGSSKFCDRVVRHVFTKANGDIEGAAKDILGRIAVAGEGELVCSEFTPPA